MEKTVTDAIEFRRSVRKFDPKKDLDIDIVKKCIVNATLAPTSSNLQLWEFYHITCLLYTSPSSRDISGSRMPSSA